MKVTLITYTPNPTKLIATAARLCYSNKADIETITDGFTDTEIEDFLEQLVESNHLSPFEHVTFTFGIEGISRVVSHELVRHRIGVAISQRSQRYCVEDGCEFIYPDGYDKTVSSEEIFKSSLAKAKEDYKRLLNTPNISKQIARYVLPNATSTRMIVTMNARELLHFFSLRCCSKAQPEMQVLANKMLEIVKEVAPSIFKYAGPSCRLLKYCPEGKRSCGAAPTLDELINGYVNSFNEASKKKK